MKTRIIKRISTATLTALLVLGSVNFAKSEETKTNTESTKIAKQSKGCNVSNNAIVLYLESFGYSNITFYRTSDPCTAYVSSDYEYDTVIYLSGNAIVGHDDDEI